MSRRTKVAAAFPAMAALAYATRYEREAGGRVHRILRFHPDSPEPSVLRVEYRDEAVQVVLDSLDAVFWGGPFTL